MLFLWCSGHELEIVEAQAKDSEDEAEVMTKRQEGERGIVTTPQNTRCGLGSPSQTFLTMQGVPRNTQDIGASSSMPDVGNKVLQVKGKEITPDRMQPKETPNQCSEISGSISLGIGGKMSGGAPSISGNISSYSVSASKIDGNSHPSSASKLPSTCYSRRTPTRCSLPLDIGHVKNSAENISPLGDALNMSPSKIELDKTSFDGEHALSTETPCCPDDAEISTLPGKRKIAVSGGSSKLQKKSHDTEFVLECALGAIETDIIQPTSLIHREPHGTTTHHSPQDNRFGTDADLEPSPSGTVTPKIVRYCSDQELQTSRKKLKNTNSASKLPKAIDVISNAPEDTSNAAIEPQHGPQNLNVPSPGAEILGIQNSDLTANLDFPMVGDDNHTPKPLKRKLLPRKALGSKPRIGKGINKKGSISMKQKVSPLDSATKSTLEEENEDLQRLVDSETLVTSPNCNVDQAKNVEMKSLPEPGNQTSSKHGIEDNETEALEDKENGLDAALCKVVTIHSREPTEVNTSKETDDNIVDMIDQTVISCGEVANQEAKNVASDEKLKMSESNLEENTGGKKKASAKKCPLVETKKKKLSPVTNSKKVVPRKGDKCKSKLVETKGKHEKKPLADTRNMKPMPEDTGKPSSQDMEKENRPVNVGGNNLNRNKKLGKVTPTSDRKHTESESGNPDAVTVGQILKEPAWFILSGHKLQRKEFQQVIKRLKGRLCRDNHQWSYQATHFIVPDPIRRTEKFFAAAASGRYVYLTHKSPLKQNKMFLIDF